MLGLHVLFQSREWLELRVVEMNPGLALLGATLAEATQMLSTHEQVLEKIHVSNFLS